MSFLSAGMGFANPRQDTMRSVAGPQQKAPQMTAGTMPVVPRGNFVVSGDAAASGFGNDSLIYGRLSLGFVASLIVFVGLAYVWTRNIQGGG